MMENAKMLELHPLCTLFPRLAGAEYAALVADIAAQGLRQPITLLDGMVLDGANRYRACLDAGVSPRFVEFDGASPGAFVLSSNLHRRHLSPGQHAAIVASAQNWALAQGNGKPGNLARLDTRADRAAMSGASDGTQKMADKVAKADPELAKAVGRGEFTLPDAIEQITGKRPGAKAKPAEVDAAPVVASVLAVDPVESPDPTPEPAVDPNHVDLLPDLMHAEGEIKRLSEIVSSLEATDSAKTIIDLHERVAGLEGRLRQESNSKNEYFKQAQYWQKRHDRAEKRAQVAEAKLAAQSDELSGAEAS
jgi:hypothetical protein